MRRETKLSISQSSHDRFSSDFREVKANTLKVIILQEYAKLKQRKLKKNEEENEDDEEENDLEC